MITRAQMPRQLRNKGGITNAVPREKYGLGSKLKERFRKLIPNELADIAVKAAPFVAPFNPGIAGLMRGIGRFDQRGSISDALKQGALVYGGGQAARMLGGAGFQKGFGTPGDRFTTPLSDKRSQAIKGLFEKEPKNLIDGKEREGLKTIQKGVDALKEKIPLLDKVPDDVAQKLLVGTITSGASALYSYFTGEFDDPQEPGETMEEYMARRRERVKTQVRAYMDSYYTPLRNAEYASMTDAQKDNFIDGVVGTGMATGGRVGYQTGGVTMANTLSENIRRNLANQAAVAQQFRQARKNIPGYVEPVVKPVQQSAQVMDPTRMIPQTSTLNPDLEQAIKNARAAGRNEEYIDTMLKERQDDQAIDFFKNLTPQPPKKVIPPRVVTKPIDIVDFYEEVTKPKEEGTIGPITKLPVEPDPDTPIDELIKPIMPTLPVEPMTDQDILEGFAKFKEQNPEAGTGIGLQVMVYGRLPDGTPLTFRNSAQANAFNQYLESIGQPPFRRVSGPISRIDDSKEKSLSTISPMGLMGIMPPMAPEGGGDFPGGIMIDGKKYFSEQEAIKDMGIEKYNQFMAKGGRVGFSEGANIKAKLKKIGYEDTLLDKMSLKELIDLLNSEEGTFTDSSVYRPGGAKGGMPTGIMRTNKAGVMERDYRDKGGFVPVGIKEKADDVPAMLSKNEFVFTADAVRGAGNGSIEKGAQRMYNTMKNLEKRVV